MFWHNFKYQLKLIFHDHALVFWTLAFPLIMATFFNLAFSNIESSERLSIIDVAVVEDENWAKNPLFGEAFDALSEPGSKEQLFATTCTTAEEAEQLLQAEKVAAYLYLDTSGPQIVAHSSNTDVTIIQLTAERIAEQSQIITKISEADPRKLAELAQAETAHLRDASSSHLSYTMIEYYTLIAMTCLYGGIVSLAAVNRCLANMSASGKRISVSPASKTQLLLGNLAASFIIQLAALALLFAYTILVLHVDYGDQLPQIILLSLVGSLTGLGLGVMVASLLRTNENAKIGIVIAISMFGCFLAGMMGITMKYIVDTNLPLVNQLNPANLITDGLYSLYYYGTSARFWGNVINLAIITLVIISLSAFALRKEQYDRL